MSTQGNIGAEQNILLWLCAGLGYIPDPLISVVAFFGGLIVKRSP